MKYTSKKEASAGYTCRFTLRAERDFGLRHRLRQECLLLEFDWDDFRDPMARLTSGMSLPDSLLLSIQVIRK